MTQDEYLRHQAHNYAHCLRVSRAKSSDYALSPTETDPFSNFRLASEGAGVPVWRLMVSRMFEKLYRFRNVMEKRDVGNAEAVRDEPPEKTLEDLIVYPNILKVWLEHEEQGTP